MFTTEANQDLHALELALPKLSAKDHDFAKSLLGQAVDKGSLSEKQMFWVRKLAQPQAAPVVAPAADFSAITTLFANNAKAKNPAIVFATKDGPALRLSKAGFKSSQPGTVNVCDDGKGFDNRVWFGRIGLDGKFTPGSKCTPAVIASLEVFAQDPAKAAAEYGHRTGNCCFCAHELDNDHSLALGYGPICAKKWGMPHSYSGKLVAEAV